jgi:hypothetical protein
MKKTSSDRLLPGRRELLLAAAASTIGIVAPHALWAATGKVKPGPHRALLDRLCDAVIPDTGTPGARAAGVPAFVELAIAHGLENAPDTLLAKATEALDGAAGAAFLSLAEQEQQSLLDGIDAAAYERSGSAYESAGSRTWRTLKALIIVGYYTSEIGGSQELRYLLTPGHFDPDVKLAPGDRAFSSDWTGVKYG